MKYETEYRKTVFQLFLSPINSVLPLIGRMGEAKLDSYSR